MTLGSLPAGAAVRRISREGLIVRMGPFQVRVASRIRHFAREFVDLYRHHPLGDPEQFIDFDIRLAAGWSMTHPRGRVASFVFSSDNPLAPLPLHQATPLFEWGLNWCVTSYAHRFVMIHAGVVARGDEAILMPGASGSGKSTLTTALCYRGWRLFSDELALIDLQQGLIYPMPRPISLKNKSIETIKAFAPEVHIGSLVRETWKGQVALLRPPADSVATQMRPARIRKILFPIFDASVPASLTPITPGRAFARLYDSTFNYGVHSKRDFAVLADLVERAPAAEIRYSNFDAAIAHIEDPTLWPVPLIAA